MTCLYKGKSEMEENKRFAAFRQMIEELDKGAYLMDEYDSLLHDYNGVVMFQAESQMIKAIGDSPGITAAHLAKKFAKSGSACSQLITKLKKKEWVSQERNRDNSREYNLTLTEAGREIYAKHRDFEEACYERTYRMLDGISREEMETYTKIQRQLNKAFEADVKESKNI